jgi:DNA-binding NarL/FixJ family response regulator
MGVVAMKEHVRSAELEQELKEGERIAADKVACLTETERDVFHLVSRGLKDKPVASCLHTDEDTVRSHLDSIYRKLSVSSRLELVIYAHYYGVAE